MLICRFHETEVADRTVNCDEAYFDVDGETRRCEKVMSIKMDWVDEYWTEPMLVSNSFIPEADTRTIATFD